MTDPLSNVLSLLNARGMVSGRAEAGGPWCIQSGAYASLRFGTVIEGTCWLKVDATPQPIQLGAGDCYLLTDGRPYRIGTDLALPAVDMNEVFARMDDGVVRWGEPVDFRMIGGRFNLDPANASFLLDSLPPVIHIRAQADPAGRLRRVLEDLATEQGCGHIGAASMVEHLSHIMLIQLMRLYLASELPPTGWLAALDDRKIGAALAAIHGAPLQRWRLESLAACAGMSRSAFALRFKTRVGISPLDYLLRWRMRLAGQALIQSKASVASVGFSCGYESETAFSAAFKRVMGVSPRAYRVANG